MLNDKSINQDNPDEYVEGIEDIKQCWRNIIFTIPGSVPLMSEFVCDYYQYLDLPISKSFIQSSNAIVAALTRWETRTKIAKVTRSLGGDGSQVFLNIEGTYKSTGESIIEQIDLSKVFVKTETGEWILATGFWNDDGVWDDDSFWID
jgi:phage baseplate assembly protein W